MLINVMMFTDRKVEDLQDESFQIFHFSYLGSPNESRVEYTLLSWGYESPSTASAVFVRIK